MVVVNSDAISISLLIVDLETDGYIVVRCRQMSRKDSLIFLSNLCKKWLKF